MGARRRSVDRERVSHAGWEYLPHIFLALSLCAAAAHLRTQIDSNDEGIAAMGAWRVMRGEVPYRDFFAVETPLSFYLMAGVYSTFGVSLTAGRIVAQILGLGMLVCVFKLSRRWIPSPLFAAIPLAFLCQAGVGIFPFASHHWFAAVFSLGALVAAARALSGDGKRGWWMAGAAASLALQSLQDQGAWMLLGLSIVAMVLPEKGSRRRALLELAGGAVIAGLPLALVLLPHAGWANLWRDLVQFPLTGYRATKGNDFGFLQPFAEILSQWTSGAWKGAPLFTASATLTCIALVAAPIAAPVLAVWSLRRRGASPDAVALLLVGSIAFLLTALHRWAPINLQWAAAAPAMAVGFFLHHEHAAAGERRWPRLAAIVLLSAFAIFGVERIVQAAQPGLWFTVESPAGATRVPGRATGRQIQEMIDAVGAHVPSGAPLVVYGWPNWGFAAGHPSPLRWDVFAPPAFPPGALSDEAIAEVEARKVGWIVTPPFPQPGPGETDAWRVYLVSRYTLEWANDGWGLWKRL